MTTDARPARTDLIAELMAGEDPTASTYPDALARITGMVDDLETEARLPDGDPLVVRWDRDVTHPDPSIPGDETLVCCLTEDGRPVALFLDDEYREALGGMLVDPNPDN